MIVSVSILCNYIAGMFDSEPALNGINVEGEVSAVNYSRGFCFFILKDSNSQINCMATLDGIKDGDKIVANGNVSFYGKSGALRFYVKKIQKKDGLGDIYKEFLILKEKLEKEGLFDSIHKKPINRYAKKIGVVTSKSGAVINDIRRVIALRNPTVDIVLYDSLVQGKNADKSLVRGIKEMDKSDVDTIIIGRGGGSMEDLACFNSEELVRAIFNTSKPVVSAVGHERDFTLCDFVADHRASTPSVAGEITTIDMYECIKQMENYISRCNYFVSANFERCLLGFSTNMKRINLGCNYHVRRSQTLIKDSLLFQRNLIEAKIMNKQKELEINTAKIESHSPLSIIKKGYALLYIGNKQIKSIKKIKTDDRISIKLIDGELDAVVKGVVDNTINVRKKS